VTVVRIPPTLRAEVGGARDLQARGDTVGDVIDDLVEQHPALRAQLFQNGGLGSFVNVYLGGEDVRTLDGLDTPVDESETVILLPAMAGGAPVPLDGGGSRRARPGSAVASPRWLQDASSSALGRTVCTAHRASGSPPLPARRQEPRSDGP
jgi:molybdopterin synthase sulfur carrier subunit